MRAPLDSRRLVATLLVALAALCPAGLGSEPGSQPESMQERGTQGKADTPDRRAARERWKNMTPAERERMRERYDRLQRMDPAQRRQLDQRAQRLNQMRRRLYESLDPTTRARLEGLPREKRLELLDEMVAVDVRRAGERVLERLPAGERAKVEAAPPAERRRMLQEHKRRQTERLGRGVQELAPALGIGPQEMSRLQNLPPEQRRRTLLEVMKRRIETAVERQGLPAGVKPEAWNRIRRFELDEFFAAVLRLRESHPDFGVSPMDRRRAERRGDFARASKWHALRAALAPSPEDRVELSGLSRSERMREMQRRSRTRALAVLKEHELLPPERIEELEALPLSSFSARLPELMRGMNGAPSGRRRDARPPRDGRRRGGGRRP